MMAGTHCAQCSDTRNIYIKTCDCSKKQVNQHKTEKFNSEKEVNKSSIVDTKKQTEEPKLKAVKAIVYKVVRVYETVPSKTMKFVGALALLFLLVAVFSVALAQNKEETKSHYGMAFPLEDSASVNSELRISAVGSVPGEGSQTTTSELSSESPITTTVSSSSEETATLSVIPVDNEKKLDEPESDNDSGPTFLIAGDTDDEEENSKPADNGEEKTNPRLVFIERLMGVHLSAPLNEQQGEKEVEENSATDNGSPNPAVRTPFDKLNAKWATRMRKFSIPLMQQQQQNAQSDPQNQLLRVAAAAMMTRLLAAAARAHQNEQFIAPKDKDDDAEDETVPLLLATMRANGLQDRPISRPMGAPMYGRPMPIRPPMIRPTMNRPPMAFVPPQARMASTNVHSVQPRMYSSPMMHLQQKAQPVMQRPFQPYQQVLIMLAHVPVQASPQAAESRMGNIGVSPMAVSQYYNAPQHSMPVYPQVQVPYSVPMGYNQMQRPVEVPVPVHVPVPVPVASYQRSVYQNPYQGYQTGYQRQVTQMAPQRQVIEIPIEIPIPVHVPVNVPMQSMQNNYQSNRIQSYAHEYDRDHEQSASDADQVAIVYLDADNHDGLSGHDEHIEPHTSESNENQYRFSPQKSYPYLSRPLPETQSATKMKLWREYIGAKHAAQPGVRYIPVAFATDDSQARDGHHSQSQLNQEHREMAESQHQPAFVILAEEGADNDASQERSL